MSDIALQPRFIFGVSSHVADNGAFFDEENCVYIAGQSLVLFDKNNKRQRFISTSDITEPITSFYAAPGKSTVVVGERGERPIAHLYDLTTFRRKKTLQILSCEVTVSKEYISLQLSENEQTLLALTNGPDYTLCIWNTLTAKLNLFTKLSAATAYYSCSMNPVDTSAAVCIGKDYVRFFRIGEKEFRSLPEVHMGNTNFTCHTWLKGIDDHMICGTECGKYELFRSGEYIFSLKCSPGKDSPIWSLKSLNSRGFVAGSISGIIYFYSFDATQSEVVYYNDQFSLVKKLQCDYIFGSIVSMFTDPQEENLGMISSDGQLLNANIQQNPSKLNNSCFSFVITEFHQPKAITGLDVCYKKPIFATTSKDNTLRFWNMKTHQLEFKKEFTEDLFSIALHPNGLLCAVGFTDKLRIYHILVEDIRQCLEIPIKACRECEFSKGGNFFAASNGNSVAIFDSYTGARVTDLRGHNGKVRSISWLDSGNHLVSCGQNGAVYVWDLDGSKRLSEYVNKGALYTSVVAFRDTAYVVGSDRNIRSLQMPDFNINSRTIEAGLVLNHLALASSRLALFTATCDSQKSGVGYVRTYAFPPSREYEEYPVSSLQLSKLKVSPDENFAITADDFGVLNIFEIKQKKDKFSRVSITAFSDLTISEQWGDDVLITKNDLEDRETHVSELKSKVEELKIHNEYQLKLKEMGYSERIKEETDKSTTELEQAKTKFELTKEEKTDLELEYVEKIKALEERHESSVQDKETRFQYEIMQLVESYQQLCRDRDAQIERLDDQRKKLVQAHELYVGELTFDLDQRLDQEKVIRIQLEDERGDVLKELSETDVQLQDDLDTEIEGIKTTFEGKLTESRERTLKYKGENGIMKKKDNLMQRELDESKEEMNVLEEREKELHNRIKGLEKEVSSYKKDIKARDLTIGEKEKKIYELKKKNQELDKFKFVLDFKIRELKLQIEPKQNEILSMREKIKNMDVELEKLHKTNADLDLLIGVMKDRIDGLQKDTKVQRQNSKSIENKISHFRSDVQLAIQHVLSPIPLKTAAKKLIADHGSSGTVKPSLDPDVEREYTRHRDYLSKSISQLKKTLEESVTSNMNINNQLMKNNMALISDINSQRESNRQLKGKVQAGIGSVRHYIQQRPKNKSEFADLGKENRPNSKASDFQSILFNNVKPIENADFSDDSVDPLKVLDRNTLRMQVLKDTLVELEKRSIISNSFSREMLPPMEGGNNSSNSNNVRLLQVPESVLPTRAGSLSQADDNQAPDSSDSNSQEKPGVMNDSYLDIHEDNNILPPIDI